MSDGPDRARDDGDPGASASTPTIRELDDRTITQIAAGEVVERPASVVKELVENSLDAGADRISVAVEAGGTEGIRVRDDGVGMDRASVERAVEEHTTSKIDTIDDLEAGVGTLGFRGEALHTIGAVSRLTIRTKPRGGDTGTELRVEGGEVTEVGPAGCPEGTVVAVVDLFYNTPARRKFLKTVATEFDHVNTVVTHYALANPEVAISLDHDDREVFATEGRGDRRATVLSVYGREVAEAMIDVRSDPGGSGGDGSVPDDSEASGHSTDDAASTPVDSVTGLVSHPETTRSTREYLSTFVNGRYVASGVLREAVLDAYGGQLAADRYPFAVLFVDLPPDAVDVNVHPRKMEVRYNNPDAVKRSVRTAIENALREEGLLRSSAPRGRSAPDETPVSPETPDTEVELTPENTGSTASDSAASTPEDTGSTASDDAASIPEGSGGTSKTSPTPSTDESAVETVDGPEAWSVDSSDSPRSSPSRPASADDLAESTTSDTASQSETQPTPDSPPPGSTRADSDGSTPTSDRHPSRSSVVDAVNTQTTLTGDDATPQTRYDSFPDLRVLGQLHDTYVVAEADDGMILVDQHAADERVHYERLQERFEGDVTTQELAEPVDVELTAREAAAFDDLKDAVARIGFRADRVGDRTVAVSTVPALLAGAAGPELIRDVIADLVDEDTPGTHSVDSVTDELLSDMACHPSITGNTALTEGSVVDLLSALDDCDNPWACPHGRPVLIRIDAAEIDNRFERDYPGHGGRRGE